MSSRLFTHEFTHEKFVLFEKNKKIRNKAKTQKIQVWPDKIRHDDNAQKHSKNMRFDSPRLHHKNEKVPKNRGFFIFYERSPMKKP